MQYKKNFRAIGKACLKSVPSDAENRVQPFRRQMSHFLTDMSNRVEHQKLNQTTAELSFG